MEKLFDKFVFKNGLTLKNRFCLAPMTTYSSNDDLTLSYEEEVYYNMRSKELGMVITAAVAVSRSAQAFDNQISIRDRRYLDSMKRLAKSIHDGGSVAVVQLHHGGRMNKPGLYENQDIVGPSSVKALRDYAVEPRELKTSEVYDIIDDFVNATKVAIEAGFDGVELHGANTYLIQQFVSPHSNRRTDEFGKNRYHFSKILVKRVMNTVKLHAKKEFIVGYRFSPEEYENPGITLDITKELLEELKDCGLDYFHLSVGSYKQTSIRNKEDKRLIVKMVKDIIRNTPLIGVGHLETKEDITEAFDLRYDLLAFGLIALSELELVSKLKEGKELNKVFSEELGLPSEMYQRLSHWNLESRGYSFKQKK
jgi:2,4-dienoyl-CoA reductase-like NADH-dependent reductase (Old Yellow Enzyme family)